MPLPFYPSRLYLLKANGKVFAIFVQETGKADQMYYIHTDHLGSYDMVTNSSAAVAETYAFDVWGYRRKNANWVSYETRTGFLFSRGFTGHEHYNGFDIINMNGRIYDPAIGRFFSPDPFVQSPAGTQGFNRYSYCLNNPLGYTDPGGEWFVIDSWIAGFFKGFFSTGSHKFDAAWNRANQDAWNDAKIWGGLFTSDKTKDFGNQVWEIISRVTWQLPQTILGFGASQAANTFWTVNSVEYYGGATVVNSSMLSSGAGMTLGSYINGGSSIAADPNNSLFQHEYGHYLQSQAMGWGYLSRVGVPSILGAMGNNSHDFQVYEQDANLRAFKYFNRTVKGFYQRESQYEYNLLTNTRKGWDFKKNPLDPYHTQNRGDYYNYYNSEHMSLLNSLSLKAEWYDIAFGIAYPFIGSFAVGVGNHIYNNGRRP